MEREEKFGAAARLSAVNEQIRRLVEVWCDRRDYRALAEILTPWLANTGMTDDWCQLHDALKFIYQRNQDLPKDERELLHTLYVEIQMACRLY